MRRLVFLFFTFFVFFTAKSQYPITQNLGSDSTLIRLGSNYGGAIKGNVVLRGYYDTTAANLVRIAQYAGSLIYTTSDNRVWRRNNTNTRWDSFATSAELSYVTGCYGLLNGGIVTWSGTGLVMNVTAAYYVINCNYYNSDGSLSVTLDAADPSNPRIDVIAVDTAQNIVVIKGTAGVNPVKPQVNPTYQVELTEIYVPAGATTPQDYTYRTVYNENTEWTSGSALSSGTANFNSTVFPSVGTKNLRVLASTVGHVYWDTTGAFLTSNYQSLSLRFSLASTPTNDIIPYIYLRDNGVQVTYSLALDGFGYSSVSGINEYNVITIPMSAFTFTSGSTFDGVGLYFGGMGSIVDVDYVQLQTGTNGGGVIGNYLEGVRRLAGSTDVEGLKNGVWQYLFTDSISTGGGGSYTFNNGLTESGGVVKLGGTLSENTTVEQNGYKLNLSTGQTVFGADKHQIGTRYNYSMATNPLTGWANNFGSGTVTTDGTGTTLSGGAFNLNNNISLTNEVFSSHNYKITQTLIVNAKTSTSYGIGIREYPLGAGQSIFAHFLLSDTAGYISFTSTNSVSSTGDANNKAYTKFIWSSGDTLDLSLRRVGSNLYIEMLNRTTKCSSKLFVGVIPPAPLGTAPFNLAIFSYGGNYKLIGNFKVEYFDQYQPKWVTMGHSINYGADAYTEATKWTSQTFERESGGWVDLSANSLASLDGTLMMPDILTYIKPKYAIIDYVVNDKQGSVPLDSFSARMTRMITQFKSAGTTPILVTGIMTGSSCVTYNDTIWALATRYNLRVIDAYTSLLGTGTNMDSKFNQGDNVHWNQYGHTQVAGTAKSILKDLLSETSPINLQNVPLSFERYYTYGEDYNGNLVKSFYKGDTSYIRNIGTELTARNVTPGSINIKGNAWIWGNDFRVLGIGNYTNPMLSVNVDGDSYVKAIYFKSAGVNFANSQITLGGVGFNTFLYDIRSYQRPWTVNFNYPSTAGSVGMILNSTNDDNGGVLPSAYKFLSIKNNGTEKAYFNRSGGLHSDTVHKYNANFGSLFDSRTLVDKGYVDSVVALGGGIAGSGTTNMVAKFTDATTVGNSNIFDDGTNIGIGTTSPSSYLAGQHGLIVKDATPAYGFTNGSKYFIHYLDAGYDRWYEQNVGAILSAGNGKFGFGAGAVAPTSTVQISGSFAPSYIAKSVDYTATISDCVIEVTATGRTITLPTAVGISGRQYTIKLTAPGSATVATTNTETIDAATTYSLSAQYKYVSVISNNANWIIISSN